MCALHILSIVYTYRKRGAIGKELFDLKVPGGGVGLKNNRYFDTSR